MGEGRASQKRRKHRAGQIGPGNLCADCCTGSSSVVNSDKLVLEPCDPGDVACVEWGKHRGLFIMEELVWSPVTSFNNL